MKQGKEKKVFLFGVGFLALSLSIHPTLNAAAPHECPPLELIKKAVEQNRGQVHYKGIKWILTSEDIVVAPQYILTYQKSKKDTYTCRYSKSDLNDPKPEKAAKD